MKHPESALRIDTTLGDHELVRQMYAPHTPWPYIGQRFHQLPSHYSFNLAEGIREMEALRAQYAFEQVKVTKTKKKYTYRGLSLTSRPNAEQPLYDALQVFGEGETPLDIDTVIGSTSERTTDRKVYPIRETMFSEFTEACTPWYHDLLAKFKSPLLKVRLLELRPGGVLTSHIDFPYYEGIRIHSILTTNDDCWWEVDGERRQLPADGNFYWMDVGKYHAVWNMGTTPRIVLSVNLSVYKNRDGSLRPEVQGRDLITLFDEAMV